MPLIVGPRNVRDDRGKVVTGRSINGLLGDVRVEAGQRRLTWGMLAGLPVWSTLFYGYLIVVLSRVRPRLTGAEWLVMGCLTLLIAGPAVYLLYRRWVKGEPGTQAGVTPRCDQAVVSVLVGGGRCGACGYGLRATRAEADGCVVCSECGAAWHTSRVARDAHTPDELALQLTAAIRHHASKDAAEADDRAVRCRIATRHGRENGLRPASASGGIVLGMLRKREQRSRTWLGGGMGGGVLLILIAVLALSGQWWLQMWIVGIGLTLAVSSLCLLTLLGRWHVRRTFFLSYRVCPCCLDELGGETAFDGCAVCGTCGAAWTATSLGRELITLKRLADAVAQCPACKYDREGIGPHTPCPECGTGSFEVVCAACQTSLEHPHSVCPRCKHQAGVVYR